MLRIPYYINNRLTDGSEVVRLKHPEIFFISVFGIHYCYRLSKICELESPEGLNKLIKFNYLIASRTCDLSAGSIVPVTGKALL
jgi:hypothetical protein